VVKKEPVWIPIVSKAPPEPEPITGEVRVAGTVSGGILPGTTFGLLAGGQVDIPGFVPLELTGYGWTERDVEVVGGGANFSMFAASLSVCPTMELAPTLRGIGCSGVGAGAMRARGFGFDHVDEGTKPVVHLSASLRLAWTIHGALFGSVGGGIHGALVRPRFVVTEPDASKQDVFQMSAVGGIGELGLGLQFRP
jgi:hypothetical protein